MYKSYFFMTWLWLKAELLISMMLDFQIPSFEMRIVQDFLGDLIPTA